MNLCALPRHLRMPRVYLAVETHAGVLPRCPNAQATPRASHWAHGRRSACAQDSWLGLVLLVRRYADSSVWRRQVRGCMTLFLPALSPIPRCSLFVRGRTFWAGAFCYMPAISGRYYKCFVAFSFADGYLPELHRTRGSTLGISRR